MKWHQKHAVALAAAAVILGSTGVAYAADLGGMRTTVTMWLHGEQTELEARPTEDGGWNFYEEGSDEPVLGGGGVWYDFWGREHPISAQEVADSRRLEVNIAEDGTVWLEIEDGRWDITDLLEKTGTAHVHAKEMYVTIEEGGTLLTGGPVPEPDVTYTELD